jgi:hypothetical protein
LYASERKTRQTPLSCLQRVPTAAHAETLTISYSHAHALTPHLIIISHSSVSLTVITFSVLISTNTHTTTMYVSLTAPPHSLLSLTHTLTLLSSTCGGLHTTCVASSGTVADKVQNRRTVRTEQKMPKPAYKRVELRVSDLTRKGASFGRMTVVYRQNNPFLIRVSEGGCFAQICTGEASQPEAQASMRLGDKAVAQRD